MPIQAIHSPYISIAVSSLWFSTLLAAGGDATVPQIACASAGVLGGAITQLLTIETRKPTRKIVLGEMLCSGVAGFAAYAAVGNHDPTTLLAAVFSGGAGAAIWHKGVKLAETKFGDK